MNVIVFHFTVFGVRMLVVIEIDDGMVLMIDCESRVVWCD